jgi:hypothetical protein
MNKRIIIQVICSILTIIGLSYGSKFSVPDAVNISYGFPFSWGVHQLVTIAGPVDIWSVNISNLVIDLVLWLLLILEIPITADKLLTNEE